MKEKHLKGKSEVDYDYEHDILFFKIKDRDYIYVKISFCNRKKINKSST